jgi:hypothetical protein
VEPVTRTAPAQSRSFFWIQSLVRETMALRTMLFDLARRRFRRLLVDVPNHATVVHAHRGVSTQPRAHAGHELLIRSGAGQAARAYFNSLIVNHAALKNIVRATTARRIETYSLIEFAEDAEAGGWHRRARQTAGDRRQSWRNRVRRPAAPIPRARAQPVVESQIGEYSVARRLRKRHRPGTGGGVTGAVEHRFRQIIVTRPESLFSRVLRVGCFRAPAHNDRAAPD